MSGVPKRTYQNIALVGFMGSGKSTVGGLVAQMLHFDFVDTDEMIEKIALKKISDIFEREGEARFRQYEQELALSLEKLERTVISTGGGFITNPGVLEGLKKHALVVCLWASPHVLLRRVSRQSHRPLLREANPLEKIQELLEKRREHYRQADVLLNSDQRSPREVALHVVQQYRLVATCQP